MTAETLRIVALFNNALNARDVDRMMSLMTLDCVFENTDPAPDGTRYEGQAAVRAFWEDFFREAPQAQIDVEDIWGSGERCVMQWVYSWVDRRGRAGHVRGVDVYRLEKGLIAEKRSYVKG